MANILRREFPAALREEVERIAWQMIKGIFCEAFQGYSFKEGRPEIIRDDTHWIAAEFSKAISDKVKEQFNESMRDEVRKIASESRQQMEERINSEAFIDQVIARILRKQL